MLTICRPASGSDRRCGPWRRVVGVLTSNRPSQLEPRVVCSSWGAAPTPAITTSTALLVRRSFISSWPASAARTQVPVGPAAGAGAMPLWAKAAPAGPIRLSAASSSGATPTPEALLQGASPPRQPPLTIWPCAGFRQSLPWAMGLLPPASGTTPRADRTRHRR
ncbi:MAG: hypothetical protein ACKOZT_13510 [Cyanobium sp.]